MTDILAKIMAVIIGVAFGLGLYHDVKAVERDDLYYMAEAIYYEARGEPISGQYGVAHVIKNRVDDRHYPNTLHGVVYQRKQFSYTFDGSMKRHSIKYSSKQWQTALKIANNVLYGNSDDITEGALNYQNIKTATSGGWRFNMVLTTRIGNHWFYKRK